LSQEESASGIVLGKEFSTSLVLFQEAIARKLGLNATGYRCLEAILRKGQMTAKALAEELRLTTGAMTGIIDHLEKAGYVERLENPTDRRSIIVRPLTTHTEVQKKLGDTMNSYRDAMSKLFEKYDANQTAAIVDFLTEFVELLKEQTSNLKDSSD